MKKILSLILTLVMCLSLCACGTTKSDSATASEVITETNTSTNVILSDGELDTLAVSLTRDDLSKSIDNNAVRSSLVGNVYSFEGTVFSVEGDHVVLEFYIKDDQGTYLTNYSVLSAKVYLPPEELVELEENQRIKVVGKVSSVTANAIVFENAYIDQYYEIVGVLKGENHSNGGAYNIKIGDSSFLFLVYFAEDVDLSDINTDGEQITFLAKISYNKSNWTETYYNAIIQ